jgi:pimeloyl-ACP methyl ester carboxylesterase
MPGLGHFPMSENPQAFIDELLPVLNEIAAVGEGDKPT